MDYWSAPGSIDIVNHRSDPKLIWCVWFESVNNGICGGTSLIFPVLFGLLLPVAHGVLTRNAIEDKVCCSVKLLKGVLLFMDSRSFSLGYIGQQKEHPDIKFSTSLTKAHTRFVCVYMCV